MLSVFSLETDLQSQFILYNSVCADMNINVESKKTKMNMSIIHFDLKIDFKSMQASLSKNKRLRAIAFVKKIIFKRVTSFSNLEELLKFLNHCCQVVPLDRSFLRNIFNI